jgi:hypothetical protein
VVLAALTMGGCRTVEKVVGLEPAERLVSPFAFERVAVLPFENLSGRTAPECEAVLARMPAIFHAELQRVAGLRVVPPAVVMETLKTTGLAVTSPREALEVARLVKADAVIVGAVTSYDPYYKPRVGLALEVYQRRPPAAAAPDILALARRGRPFPIRPNGAVPVAVLDRIYDSADRDVDRAVRRFARQRDARGSAFGTERYFHDMEKYLSFACRQAIRDLIAMTRKREDARAKPDAGQGRAPIRVPDSGGSRATIR